MTIERPADTDYVHVLKVKVKKETALLLINEQLEIPIVFTTMRSNAARVSALVNTKRVPEVFIDAEIPKNSQSYSMKFLILLMAYLKQADNKKIQGFSPNLYGEHQITENHINLVNTEKLLESFRSRISVKGKNLADYFALECIKVSRSTLYNISKTKEGANLPKMEYGRVYTPEEIDQWRQYLKNRTYKRYFIKEKETAF